MASERYWTDPQPGDVCAWCGFPFEPCYEPDCDCPDHAQVLYVDGEVYCGNACARKDAEHRRTVVAAAALHMRALTARGRL